MCGITGILALDGAPVKASELERFNEAQAHRGPDGHGLFVDGSIGLGHRRLAVLDLEHGAQPQCNEDRTVHITFNGEIYNYRELRTELIARGHRFRTQSDTEVIIHAYEEWGQECLHRLRGMFAFGIWDGNRKELFLARDRFGIKPLCYGLGNRCFVFASEIGAFRHLDSFDATLDLQAIDIYLHFQYIPAPFCAYREIRKLPPAHYMVVDSNGRVSGPTKYWDFEFESDRTLKEEEWVERLDAALAETVRTHLISDVPFGAFLSGGVDSSIVVGHMSRMLDQPVRSYTIGFDDAAYDERTFAQEASKVLGTMHHETVLDESAFDLLPRLTDHYGEPFGDSSAVCAWKVSEAARKDVKMVLSGDGGDELFAGYDYFRKIIVQHPQPSGLVRKTRRVVGNALRTVGMVSPIPAVSDSWYHRSPFFSEAWRRRLWRPDYQGLIEETYNWNERQFDTTGRAELLDQCQYVDIHNYLPSDNLAKMDIASMAHGLEVRVPLLDHVFMETVRRIPPELRVRFQNEGDELNTDTPAASKYLLKKSAEKFFHPDFIHRRKLGFSAPIPAWLNAAGTDRLWHHLMDDNALFKELFDTDLIRNMLAEHEQNPIHGDRLWSLLFLAEWNRRSTQVKATA